MAYWNEAYYEARAKGGSVQCDARSQQVFALNVRANRVLKTVVGKVHVDKGLGIAEITPESMKEFCRRHFPDQYKKFAQDMEAHPETLILDFENVFTGLETTAAYTTLYGVIGQGGPSCPAEKCDISCFIALQQLRSHAVLKSLIEAFGTVGIEKWEYFWMLKRLLESPRFLFDQVYPLATSQWIIHRAESHTLPLPDSPVLVKSGRIMLALSPRMLLEVNRNVKTSESHWIVKEGICRSKLTEYRRRAIANTFKELIFHDGETLRAWQATSEWKQRVNLMSNADEYNRLIALDEQRQILQINALGNTL